MLRSIRLTNFRSFAESGVLPLRPLTLILGPNSSGKSSILKAISLVRQTVAARDPSVPLVLNGPYLDLGSYHDVVFRHSLKRTLGLCFSLDAAVDLEADYARPTRRRHETTRVLTLSGEFGYFARPTRVYWKRTTVETEPTGIQFRLEASGAKAVASVSRGTQEAHATVRPEKFYGLADRGIGLQRWTGDPPVPSPEIAWLLISHEFTSTFQRVLHLGPLRDTPHRTYVVGGEAPLDVGSQGESAIQALWAASRKKVSRPAFVAVNDWLRRLDMAKEIRFRRISPTQYVVEVEDARTGVVSSLPDVGFGVSQILPALIQLQLMAPQSTLLMEQPEIHLHPTLQTALTDVLISATDTKRQVIAETHSELLLSRLQRRIAERKIALESVAILYVEMTPEGSVARELRLDEFGNFIDQLPTGFFSEEYTERLEQAKSVALRQRPAS